MLCNFVQRTAGKQRQNEQQIFNAVLLSVGGFALAEAVGGGGAYLLGGGFRLVAQENYASTGLIALAHLFAWINQVFDAQALVLAKELMLLRHWCRYGKRQAEFTVNTLGDVAG